MAASAADQRNDTVSFSYVGSCNITFGQMQDLIRTQNSLLAKLKYMLEKKKDSVTKDAFEDLKQKLEEEKRLHQITKSQLENRENELQFALNEVALLSRQLEAEKEKFSKTYRSLVNSQQRKSQETNALLDKCTEISEVCGVQDDALKKKDKTIEDLKQKLAKQSQGRRIAENEAELRIQQERFLVGQRDVKKSGTTRSKSSWK
ncbi:spermatogenesis-associated protein 24-like [Rhopilema esculentum]|uniref:spermatogenesis-associated protein 24-like n=1 Tax=Rhopilema esculentum TaxID=499914 RepID=UPI0031D20A48